ncbi:hypothetical protein [Microbacterium binotii]|uniref:hypothetical protein n=1 Tax=Microbacterium binotii TaxID=462710 RepID=UPI001F1BB51D|nr:hypothetical protein [Microbacterium binotii]UIN31295.1 hypothetical protein LXM64_03565 [Microbacterium binotii]
MSRFYYTIDGRNSTEFVADLRSPKEQLAHLLGLLHAGKRSTFTLAPVPDGVEVLRFIRSGGSDVFLQCAGTGDQLTIEWRRREDDGETKLYTLGHSERRAPELVTIEFFHGERSTQVHPDEVFSADEAVEIFYTYLQTGTIPSVYALREFDMTWPKP